MSNTTAHRPSAPPVPPSTPATPAAHLLELVDVPADLGGLVGPLLFDARRLALQVVQLGLDGGDVALHAVQLPLQRHDAGLRAKGETKSAWGTIVLKGETSKSCLACNYVYFHGWVVDLP